MAEAAAQAPNISQEAIEKYYADKYAKAPFMQNKGDYADLYTYVQIYRIAEKKCGVKNTYDYVHKYMLAHAKELKMPKSFDAKRLDTLHSYSAMYSGSNTKVATPLQIQFAAVEYEKDRVLKKADAEKAKKDTLKSIDETKADKRVQTSKRARNSWGKFFSRIAQAAAIIGGIVLLGAMGGGVGVLAGMSGGMIFGAGALTIAAQAGTVWGFNKLVAKCDSKIEYANTKIQEMDIKLEDLKRTLEKNEIALDKALTKEAGDAKIELVQHPDYTPDLENEDLQTAQAQAVSQVQQTPQQVAQNERQATPQATPQTPQQTSPQPPQQTQRPVVQSARVAQVPTVDQEVLKDLKKAALRETLPAGVKNVAGQETKVCHDVSAMVNGVDSKLYNKTTPIYLANNQLVEENDADREMNAVYGKNFHVPQTGFNSSATLDERNVAQLFYVSSLTDEEAKNVGISPEQKQFIDRMAYKAYAEVKSQAQMPNGVKASVALYEGSGKQASMKEKDDKESIEIIQKYLEAENISQILVEAGNDQILQERKKMVLHAMNNPEVLAQLPEDIQKKCRGLAYEFANIADNSSIHHGAVEQFKNSEEYKLEQNVRGMFALEILSDPSKITQENLSLVLSIAGDNSIVGKTFTFDGSQVTIESQKLIELAYNTIKTLDLRTVKDPYLKKQVQTIRGNGQYKDIDKKSEIFAAVESYNEYFDGENIKADKIQELMKPENEKKLKAFWSLCERWDELNPNQKEKLKSVMAHVVRESEEIEPTTTNDGDLHFNIKDDAEHKKLLEKIAAEDLKLKDITQTLHGKVIGVLRKEQADLEKYTKSKEILAENEVVETVGDEQKTSDSVWRKMRKSVLSAGDKKLGKKEVQAMIPEIAKIVEDPSKLTPQQRLTVRAFLAQMHEDNISIPRQFKGAITNFTRQNKVLTKKELQIVKGKGKTCTIGKDGQEYATLTAEEEAYRDAREFVDNQTKNNTRAHRNYKNPQSKEEKEKVVSPIPEFKEEQNNSKGDPAKEEQTIYPKQEQEEPVAVSEDEFESREEFENAFVNLTHFTFDGDGFENMIPVLKDGINRVLNSKFITADEKSQVTEKLTELETYENKLKEKTQEEPVAEEFVVNEDQQKIQKEFAELMNINPESMTSEELSNFLNRINKCYEVGYNKAYLTDEQSDTLMNLGKSVHGKIFADQSEVEKPQQEPVVAEDTADEEVVVNEDQQKIQKEFEELMNTDYSSMSNEDLVKLYDRVNECYWNGFNKNYLTIEQCETLVNLGKNIHDKVFTEQSEVEKPQQEPVVAEEVIEETPVEEVQPEVVVESIEDDDKKSTVQIDPIDLTSYSDGQIIFDENGALRVYVDSQRSKSENETITEPQSDEDKIKEYKARFAQYNGGKEFNLKDFIKGMESSKKLGKADKYLKKFEEYISKCIGEMVANSNDPEFVKFGKAHIKKIKDVAWNEIGSNNAYSASIEKVGKELSKDGKNKEVLKELELFVHPGQKYSPGVLLEYEIPEKISSDKELEALLDNIEQTRELLAFYEEEGIQNSWADALEQHVEKALSVMDAYVQALNEKDVEEVKPEVIEEIVEDTPIEEQPEVIEEAVEEVIEETPVEEVQPEIIEKVIPEIVAEQPVEEVQPEVIEEVVEEQPIEELQSEVVEQVIEEVVEETPVEEVQPEVIEEVVPEIVEEQPVEEVQPEVIEEVVPEIVEEQSVEEVQPEVIEEVVEDTQPKVVPFAALNPETFTEEEAAAYADFRMSQEYDPTQIAEDLKNGNKRLQFSKLSKKKGAVLEIVDLKENADESQS